MSNRKTVTAETAEPAPEGAGEALVPEPLTPQQLEDLKNRAARADDNWERLLRTTADFENFKKRAAREREDATRYANESLIKKLVTVLDNFDMALAAAEQHKAAGAQSLPNRRINDPSATARRAHRSRPRRS